MAATLTPSHASEPGDVLVLGTDTDAGKTTFALLWLALFSDAFDYWKPLETGRSDTQAIRDLIPGAVVHPPLHRFDEAVAPLLAARRQGVQLPTAEAMVARKPRPARASRRLLIETFGGAFSPLDENDLQIALVRRLGLPTVLVTSSSVGAIGRTVQCLVALGQHGLRPAAFVLLGPHDAFAHEQLSKHAPAVPAFSLAAPAEWTSAGLARAAAEQASVLRAIAEVLAVAPKATASSSSADGGCASATMLVERDRKALWHPYTPLREPEPPVVCVAAQDEFLHLADGRLVIDAISSWWTILHGHRHPPLMAALREAAERYDHVYFAGVTHPPAIALAELLLHSLDSRGRVFYSDNGSTAVEVALKMAYQFWVHHGEPGRTCFIGFEHGYHGDTFGAMAVSRDPVFFGAYEPLLFRADILPLSAERLDEQLRRHASRTAAVIVEPLVQGAGGMRLHTPMELRALFEVARTHGVLFIADEVMTGGGRLGPLWAHGSAGIAPDLICAAKTLTGGMMPLAATIAAPRVVDAFETAERARTFFHGHSFTAHPLACAVAAANWRHLLDQSREPRAGRLEAFWESRRQAFAQLPRLRDVRIRGSICALEVDAGSGYLAEAGRAMRRSCIDEGVLLRPLGNVLYAMPPLCTSDVSLDRIANAMMNAVRALSPK